MLTIVLLTARTVAMLVPAATPAVLAQAPSAVIVRVDGTTEYAPGQEFTEGTRLQVPPQARLELLVFPAFEGLTIRGPYDGPLLWTPSPAARDESEDGWALTRWFTGILTADRLAAVRSGAAPEPPDPWLVALSERGQHRCVQAGQTPSLWQPAPKLSVEVTVRHLASGLTTTIQWPQGSEIQPWPQGLPIEDGAEYEIEIFAFNKIDSLTLHVAPGDSGPVDTIRALLERECLDQALLMIERLPKAAIRP